MSLTLPGGHKFVQFLNVVLLKSTIYPVAQVKQLVDWVTQPEQLMWQVAQVLVKELANVPVGQLVEETQVLVTEFKNVPEEQDVHVKASVTHVLHEVEHLIHVLPGSG